MIKVRKEGAATSITPEYIKSKLFSFADLAQHFHLETKSFAEHKALQELYEGLNGFRDEIPEILMGYLNGERIGVVKIEQLKEYSQEAVRQLIADIIDFAYDVYEWAGDNKYCDIENNAQDLSGLAAKCGYLLTLK